MPIRYNFFYFLVILFTLTGHIATPVHSQTSAKSGTVVVWGADDYGQSTVPSDLNDVVAMAGGQYHSIVLKTDGTLRAWGSDLVGQSTVPSDLNDAISVAAGSMHNLVLTDDGMITAWGGDWFGQSTVPVGLDKIIGIAAGYEHSLAIREDGTVVAWGFDDESQATVPSGLKNVVDVAAGFKHSIALRQDGTVVAWGDDFYGQSSVPSGLDNVVAIASGMHHNLALREDGTVVAWGWNSSGQTSVPSGLEDVIAVSAASSHSLALREDGTVVAWGSDTFGETSVPSELESVVAIAAGHDHSLALVEGNDETRQGDYIIEVEFVSIENEHVELQDGKLSPGENVLINFKFKNVSNETLSIKNLNPISRSKEIRLKEINKNRSDGFTEFPYSLSSGSEITISIPIQIINWPDGNQLNLNFQWENEDDEIITHDPNITLEIFVPTLYRIDELREALEKGTLSRDDYISTSYVPFKRTLRVPGLTAVNRTASVLSTFTGAIDEGLKSIFKSVAKKKAQDVIFNKVFGNSLRYNYLWAVAGTEKTNEVDPYKNIFLTNEPSSEWTVPALMQPVKVIAKIEDVFEHISTSTIPIVGADPVDSENVFILEPLTFISLAEEYEEYEEYEDYSHHQFQGPPSVLDEKKIRLKGVVHQVWQGSEDIYYFSIATYEDDPFRIPLVGEVLNLAAQNIFVRTIIKTENKNHLPKIGSTVDIKGVFQYQGNSIQLPQKRYWRGSRFVRDVVSIDEITILNGSFDSNFDEKEEFWNSRFREGPLSVTVTKVGSLDKQLSSNLISNEDDAETILSANIHIYDQQGNHTGYVYDDNNELIGLEMDVEGTFYTIIDCKPLIIIENAIIDDLIFQFNPLEEGEYTLSASFTAQENDTLMTESEVVFFENKSFQKGEIYQQSVSASSEDDGDLKIENKIAEAYLSHDIWGKNWINESKTIASISIRELSSSSTLNEIDISSVKFGNGYVPDEVIFNETESGISELLIKISGEEILSIINDQVGVNHPFYLEFTTDQDEDYKINISVKLNEYVKYKPESVILVSPTDGQAIAASDQQFKWENDSFANQYSIQISEDENFDDLIVEKSSISDTTFTLQTSLPDRETFYWRVRGITELFTGDWSEIWSFTNQQVTSLEDPNEVPKQTSLKQNYPNPFNPTTQVQYALAEQAHVTFEVYNLLGQRIALLVNEVKNPGRYEVNFDASGLSSGVYLYRLQTDSFMETRQMMLIK